MEKTAGVRLLHPRVGDDVVEQLAAITVLHDEEDLPGSINDLEQLDDVFVAHALEDGDLAADTFHVRWLHNAALLQDFDGYFLPGHDVRTDSHFAESALTQRLAQQVVANALGLPRVRPVAAVRRRRAAMARTTSHGCRLTK